MRKYVTKLLIIGMAVFGLATFLPADTIAAQIDVYLEGAYDDTYLDVYIYADLNVPAVISYGVRLEYLTSELTFVSAAKNASPTPYTSNETLWKLGGGVNQNNPDPVNQSGKVVFKGGILNENRPTDGVTDTRRVFLGTVRFEASGGGPMPTAPTLSLTYAEDYSSSSDTYKNFVRYDASLPEGVVIDTRGSDGVNFDSIRLYPRGDSSEDGKLDGRDIRALRMKIGIPNLPSWNDCNGDGAVDGRDIRCLRLIL